MSHVETIKLKVLDAMSLDYAMTKCGLIRREQSTYKWFGSFQGDYPLPAGYTVEQLGKCNFAYALPNNAGAYEIGVSLRPDGSYQLLWDFWQGGFGLEQAIGKDGCKLISEYEAQVYNSHMSAQGYEMTEQVLQDGTRKLSAVRYV